MSAGTGARQAGPPPSDTVDASSGLSMPPRRLVDRWLLPLLLVVAFVAIMAWVGSQRVVGEFLPAAAWLRAASPRARVLARKPHLPYLAGAERAFLPPVASPEALATVLCQEGVTHVVWDGPTRTRRPSLAARQRRTRAVGAGARLLEPRGKLLVYEVRLDAVCPGRAAEPRGGQNRGVAARSAESSSGPG